jgi:hypothetical protein
LVRTVFSIILAAVTVWALTVLPARSEMCLALVGKEPERVLALLPAAVGTTFQLEFINSIYLAKVRESFVCTAENGISLTTVESPSYGVFEYYGLVPDRAGIAYLSRSVGEIRLRSHNYENHLLIAGDKQIHLREIVDNGEFLIIRVLTGERCKP